MMFIAIDRVNFVEESGVKDRIGLAGTAPKAGIKVHRRCPKRVFDFTASLLWKAELFVREDAKLPESTVRLFNSQNKFSSSSLSSEDEPFISNNILDGQSHKQDIRKIGIGPRFEGLTVFTLPMP